MAVRHAMKWFAIVVVLGSAGCAGRAEVDAVTESEAYERVESYVRRAATAFPDGTIEAASAPVSVACKGKPPGRVVVRNSYWVRDLADENRHFDTMVRWWESHGFEVVDDLRPERHYVWVESATDGFRMSLRDNDKGELLLGAESPCVAEG